MEISRRGAQAMTRTAVNHTATNARELMYTKNQDVIASVQWVSTLDGRTTPICQARDGMTFPVNEGPRPPAHINCRSCTVPVTKTWRELGFDVDEAPESTRASFDGQVPEKTTYNDWLKGQDAKMQDSILGPGRGELFRQGVSVDKFVDLESGKPFTLKELAGMDGMKDASYFYERQEIPKNGWVHGRQGQQELRSDAVIFGTKNWDVAEQYAGKNGSMWLLEKNNKTDILDITNEVQQKRVWEDFYADYKRGVLSTELDVIYKNDLKNRWYAEINPRDIVDSAGLWDSPSFVDWFSEKYVIDGVITEDGIVILNYKNFDTSSVLKQIAKKEDTPMAAKKIIKKEHPFYTFEKEMKTKYGSELYAKMSDSELEILEALERDLFKD